MPISQDEIDGLRAGKKHVVSGVVLLGGAVVAFILVAWINGGAPTRVNRALPIAERIPSVQALWVIGATTAVAVGLIMWGLFVAPRRRRP